MLLCVAAISCTCSYGGPLDWTVTLLPSPDLSGPPGSTLTWGYSIDNLSNTDWLVTTGVNAGVFLNGTPDSSVFDFPIIAPESSADGTLYQFTWDPMAPIGFVNSGTFQITADYYSGDPSEGGGLRWAGSGWLRGL